jgi:flagellar motor switch protein FliN/FliY
MKIMSEGVLSQEEIDALLRSEMSSSEPVSSSPAVSQPNVKASSALGELSELEKDAVGEVANIVMGSAATALSTLLGKKVEITAPVVELTDPDKLRQDYPLPYLLVNVEYLVGLTGSNVLIIRDKDARVMVDLMMDGDGQAPPGELGEMHLSAISEAMNQMMGSASTAMSTIIKERVEISPPTVEVINFATDELKGSIGTKGQVLAKVVFRMTIEDLVDSELMQLIPLNFAKSMVRNLMAEMDSSEPVIESTPLPKPPTMPSPYSEPIMQAPPQVAATADPSAFYNTGTQMFGGVQSAMPGVNVQPVQFAPLNQSYQHKEMTNIDLIMDVPLQITVELGKTRKTIRDILAFAPGSVVELDKLAGEPVDLLVNGKLIAKGEVVVIDENFGIRVTDIITPMERVTNLQ